MKFNILFLILVVWLLLSVFWYWQIHHASMETFLLRRAAENFTVPDDQLDAVAAIDSAAEQALFDAASMSMPALFATSELTTPIFETSSTTNRTGDDFDAIHRSSDADPHFACTNISALQLLDDAPLRTGTHKAVWRAKFVGAGAPRFYVIKRPLVSDSSNATLRTADWRRAVRALEREATMMKGFQTWHVVVPYGGCFDTTLPVGSTQIGLVTEYFEHYKLTEFLELTVPWCIRARVAIGFLTLARQLSEASSGPSVYCDWSLQHFVVRQKDYRVVVVDLSPLKTLRVRNGDKQQAIAFNADQRCKSRPAHFCHTHNGGCEIGWHRGVPPIPDGRCDRQTGMCVGFDYRTHAWYVAKTMLVILATGLVDQVEIGSAHQHGNLSDSDVMSITGNMEFRAVMQEIATNMAVSDKRQRLSIPIALNRLKYLYASYGGQDCTTKWQWHERRQ